MFKTIAGVFTIFALFSCQKASVTEPVTETIVTGETVVNNVNKTTMLQLVNAVRATGCNCGTTAMPPVGAVTWNDQLSLAAVNHSRDMQSQNYFEHLSKDGTDPGTRITAAGYTWRTYGENIALGYTSEQAVMDGWIKSEGHCKNIMNGSFKEVGAGRAGNYWTQEFGAK